MKGFFDLFKVSMGMLTEGSVSRRIRCLVITGMLIALSMALEGISIDIPYAKVNFAYIAIAVVGMLFGPSVGFFAGCIGDIVGFMVHPTGAFLPVYTLFAGLQGIIYGVTLFKCRDGRQVLFDISLKKDTDGGQEPKKGTLSELALRIIIARTLDVVLINLICNTTANYHYKFITADTLSAAIKIRIIKNIAELPADFIILFAVMPAVLAAYKTISGKYSSGKA